MRKIFMLALVPILSLMFMSCSQVNKITGRDSGPVILEPKTVKKGEYTFVIPANFSYEEKESLVYEAPNLVRAYLVYVGKGDLHELIKFFDEYLYKLGWQKEGKLVGEEAILSYSRNDGQLIVIKIEPRFSSTLVKILLTKK